MLQLKVESRKRKARIPALHFQLYAFGFRQTELAARYHHGRVEAFEERPQPVLPARCTRPQGETEHGEAPGYTVRSQHEQGAVRLLGGALQAWPYVEARRTG